MPEQDRWTVTPEEAGRTLAEIVRTRLGGAPWRRVQGWIRRGKVTVADETVRAPGWRLGAGDEVAMDLGAAPDASAAAPRITLVHEDSQVVVIAKPAGVSSVPFDDGERDSALQQLLERARRTGGTGRAALYVVHRIDRETSGLLAFARTKAAERILAAQLRLHTVERLYLAIAHGEVAVARIESRLVTDRGDGLRGSARRQGVGKRAVTRVQPVRPLEGATLCEVRLETGRTHQVRIHLAERGHPLVGERVYVRDFVRAGGSPIAAPRLMLHAATLGFSHPDGRDLRFELPPPEDFQAVVRRLEPHR